MDRRYIQRQKASGKEKEMRFEVTDQSGRVVMHSESADVLYTAEELQEISGAGYRFRIDGKAVSLNKLLSADIEPKPAPKENRRLF